MSRRRRLLAALLAVPPAVCACVTARPAPDPAVQDVPFRVVRPAVAFEILRDNPEIFVLDLRPLGAYKGDAGHLNGAVNIPLARLEERMEELARLRRRTFLVYCDDSDCGPRGMRLLRENGYRFPVLMAGGVPHWKAAGFGVVFGPDPIPQELKDAEQEAASGPASGKTSVKMSGPP
ncbi:MAG: rhodanese-like domain-containing protein [Thermoanaerobaculia bacterium]